MLSDEYIHNPSDCLGQLWVAEELTPILGGKHPIYFETFVFIGQFYSKQVF